MQPIELNDAQWCFMDMLMRARAKGIMRLNRMEVLSSRNLPDAVKIKLVFGALTIPPEFVRIHSPHDFEITEAGRRLYELRFGAPSKEATPSQIADNVIALPDLTRRVSH